MAEIKKKIQELLKEKEVKVGLIIAAIATLLCLFALGDETVNGRKIDSGLGQKVAAARESGELERIRSEISEADIEEIKQRIDKIYEENTKSSGQIEYYGGNNSRRDYDANDLADDLGRYISGGELSTFEKRMVEGYLEYVFD